MGVKFRNASKQFGSGSSAIKVLIKLNMNVRKGSIYGLLGASGCGKTTLLSCIVGRLKLDSGELKVFGKTPRAKGSSSILGPRIGYMPQELSLIEDMTIKNVFYYFGWMFGMTSTEIAERLEFLSELLELPVSGSKIMDLSGGQQRRVSLGVSLVQTPELLLLDEPTVGLDPLLRYCIWNHLLDLSRNKGMTIILTTHYIEEAMQADKIGLLRDGQLLTDAAPADVLLQYNCSTLEDVFLMLSSQQTETETETYINTSQLQLGVNEPEIELTEEANNGESRQKNTESYVDTFVDFDTANKKKLLPSKKTTNKSINHMKALLYKDILSCVRNYIGLSQYILLPLLSVLIFITATGRDGQHMPLAVVNDEFSNCGELISDIRKSSGAEKYDDDTCHYYGLSCLYIDLLQASTTVNIIEFKEQKTALAAAKRTINQAVIYFPSNFSKILEFRHNNPLIEEDDNVEKSEVKAWIDMSDFVIGHQLKRFLYDKYMELMEITAIGCDLNKNVFKTPFKFLEPVYGNTDISELDSILPGVIVIIMHSLSAAITSSVFTTEKINGVWERNMVAGASGLEIVSSHIISNIPAAVVLATLLTTFVYVILGIQCKGSLLDIFIIQCVQCVSGIAYGIFCSTMAKNMFQSLTFANALVQPYFIISGIMWPHVALPVGLKYLSYFTPVVLSALALNNIAIKGFGLFHAQVIPGLLLPVAWSGIFFIASVLLIRRR